LSKKKGIAKKPMEWLVIDSSIALAWCFTDEQDDYSRTILDSLATRSAIVPSLWHLEITNVLLVNERRKRCTQADSSQWMSFLDSLPITVDDQTPHRAFSDTAQLGRTHGLSAYDAAYLELALRRGTPLATLDEKLKAAAKTVGVMLYAV
jgi:predicted nucleic acid-binding protein